MYLSEKRDEHKFNGYHQHDSTSANVGFLHRNYDTNRQQPKFLMMPGGITENEVHGSRLRQKGWQMNILR